MWLRDDLVEDEEGNAKDKHKRQHGLARLAVAVERRKELVVGLPHVVVRPTCGLVNLLHLVLLLQKLAREEAQQLRQFEHLAFHHPVWWTGEEKKDQDGGRRLKCGEGKMGRKKETKDRECPPRLVKGI